MGCILLCLSCIFCLGCLFLGAPADEFKCLHENSWNKGLPAAPFARKCIFWGSTYTHTHTLAHVLLPLKKINCPYQRPMENVKHFRVWSLHCIAGTWGRQRQGCAGILVISFNSVIRTMQVVVKICPIGCGNIFLSSDNFTVCLWCRNTQLHETETANLGT